MAIKYKGRTFRSDASLANAMKQDIKRHVDQSVRRAAGMSGAQVRRTAKGYEVKGTERQLSSFYRRLDK